MTKHTVGGWRSGSLARLGLALQLVCAAGCTDRAGEPRGDEVETTARALTVPTGFIDETFVSGLDRPTAMQFAPDGRLFVAQQGGRLRVVKNGQLLTTPFVALSVDSNGERGLLGITFDPGFASNGFLYIYYTTSSGGVHNRLSRFTASGDVAVAGSEVVLSNFDNLSSATNHNGGAVHVGTDGKLYVAVGENANGNHAQTLSNRLGKLHRYNLDGSIPSDNPFFTTATGANRSIWALGLRNPYTFAVQPGTGKIFINDVGENTFEEIDQGIAGANYGWPRAEGPNNNGPGDTAPLYSYQHSSGGCSIAGGAFYNPTTAQFPSAWIGHYFFADYCAGWIRRLDTSTNQATGFATGASSLVDLKVSNDGALYYLDRGTGAVGRIRSATNQSPRIDVQPASQTVAVGQSATFSVSASGTAPLSYQWQRNGTNLAGANAASFTLAAAAAADSGAQFRVLVSNVAGSVTSNAATLTVSSNRPPVATITSPLAATAYVAGTTINYTGTGSDPEDGTLGGAAFTWEVVFHHDTHTHPVITPQTGAQAGSFVIPDRGETSTNVFYRVHLTVRDAGGLTHHTSVDLSPRTANIILQTTPTGLQVTLDGQPLGSPATVSSVVGMIRTLGVVSPQNLGGTSQVFASWSDGGAATHEIGTPASDGTYVATFTPTGPSAGLAGDYFDNRDLTGLSFSRIDPVVDFNWGTGTPDPRLGPDTFSVRWTGTVTATTSETYTFYTRGDDGVRLWVNDRLLIDNWVDQSATERSATIALTGAQATPIRLEYYENAVDASMRLSWSSASVAKQVIPQTRLSPPAPTAGSPIKINFQLEGSAIPAGYLADVGATFGPRGGESYGWNVSHTDVTRDRNTNPDQRLDTLCHFHAGGIWEIALPNGTYNVLVSIGDPSFASTHTLNVEGTNYWNALALGSSQFRSATKAVTVSDGRLTINQGSAGDKATRINYLEITR